MKKEKILNATTQVVREAMRIVAKDVQLPKCVRDGLVKPIHKLHDNQQPSL